MEDLKDDILPSAAPTDDELRRWLALSHDEQTRRTALALRQGFESGISSRSINEIIASAKERISDKHG